MTLRPLLLTASVVAGLAFAGCATMRSGSAESAPSAEGTATAASAAVAEAEAPSAAVEEAKTTSVAEKPAVAATTPDTPRSTFRAEREARAASAAAAADANGASGATRSVGAGEAAKLIEQLGAATKELATLRAANAKLRAEKSQPATATAAAPKVDPAEEKLAASFKSYTAFKQEVASVFAETERVRQENAALGSNLKTAVEQVDEARGAVAKLEKDLRAEQRARAEAEKIVAQLREQLRAVARAVSAAGLNVEKLSGAAETTSAGKR